MRVRVPQAALTHTSHIITMITTTKTSERATLPQLAAAFRSRGRAMRQRIAFGVPLLLRFIFKRDDDGHTIILARGKGGFSDGNYMNPVVAHVLGNEYMIACITHDIHRSTVASIRDSEGQKRTLSTALEIINGKGGAK